MADKKFNPLLLEEISSNGGFTHIVPFTANDLTESTDNTAQTLTLPKVPKGFVINKAMLVLVTAFEDKSDADYNSTTFILGDAGDDDRYITSAQINKHGTPITYPKVNNTAFQVTADTELLAKFGSMAAKNLANIDKGEVHLLLQIIDTRILSELQGSARIVK